MRQGTQVTVTGVVGTDAEKQALLDAAKAAAPGATIVDKVTVTAGANAPAASALAPLLAATLKGDGGVAFDGKAVTLTGAVADDAAKTAAGTAAAAAFPGATVTNNLTVAPASAAGCSTLPADLKAITAASKITFDTDGSTLVAGQDSIAKIADKWKACATAKLVVTGYTDNTGDAAYNVTLSGKRADAVKAALVSAGVKADAISASGKGADNPIADNGTDAGRSANRRVEITVG